MKPGRIKDALISILIGAIIAFITAFLEGTIEQLQGTENNIIGGVSSAVTYLKRTKVV